MTITRWILADDRGLAGSAIEAAYGPLLSKALWARGHRDPAAAAVWLGLRRAQLPPWDGLPDLPKAVERVLAAVHRRQPVAVFGDYDVDGLTATAIVVLLLRSFGLEVAWRLPQRQRDGYGLNDNAVADLAAWLTERQAEGRPLLILVDCGTSNAVEIASATAAGLDVVVLDHHTVSATLPEALALVNPKRTDRDYPFRELTAAGLACYLARGVLATVADGPDDAATTTLKRDIMALAALGSAADVAPLTADNRSLVAWGIVALRARQRPGIGALLRRVAVAPSSVSAESLVWRVAPRLNAAGRMASADIALELLLTDEPEAATALANQLDDLNRLRQQELERMLEEARLLADEHGSTLLPVLAGPNWGPGLVGLVAGRLSDELARPVVAIGGHGQYLRGSARAPAGFHITEALARCRHLLVRFGGHAQAAGLTIRPDDVPALRAALAEQALVAWPDGPPPRTLHIDARASLAEFHFETVRDLDSLEPFGHQNAEPVWLVERLRVLEARTVGTAGQHLHLQLAEGDSTARAIAFRLGPRLPEVAAGTLVDIACTAKISNWRGQDRLEVHVRDLRPSSGA